jgi:hypothetical protein
MPQNAVEIKNKIISTLQRKGPSLPVHISSEVGLSILFTSAFLSELFSEKKIKMSHMRIGSSPVYFLQGQEASLEKFSSNLKSKEKEAFLLLKERKFLKDSEQHPAIRVALRAIKDFAVPFNFESGEIYWRYYIIPIEEFKKEEKQEKLIEQKEEKQTEIPEKPAKKEPKEKKPARKRKQPSSQKNKFLDIVKNFLSDKSVEIINIETIGKNELIFRIKHEQEEKILVAYNKKKITEADIIKANKKATELNLKFIILSLGEPLKKINNLIDALKNLSEIKKIG